VETCREVGPPSALNVQVREDSWKACRYAKRDSSAQRPWCKLHGQGPRAEAEAARRLPPRSCDATTGELVE
jgi:hypothetical protein